MKNILYIVLGIIALISCEDVVEVDLNDAPPRLVIDASIERRFSKEGIFDKDVAFVTLSLTTPFFKQERNFVDNAEVFITNIESNINYELENTGTLGNYILLDNSFNLESNVDYKLTVNYNNETYESIERMAISTPFTEIKQVKNNNNFDEDGVAVEIAFNDIGAEDNFYFLNLGDANFATIEDEFFTDGKEIRFTFFFDENVTLNHLFRIYGSNMRFNTFMDAIIEISSGGSNGPFGTVPFKARGNIVNTTNKENFPFGFFRISEVYPWSIELVPNKDFVEPKLESKKI